MDTIPQYPIIYTSKHFRDYFIYSNKGTLFIRTLPYLELYNKVDFNKSKNLALNNLYLQYYEDKNGTEDLYILDQSEQTLYVLGDSSNN